MQVRVLSGAPYNDGRSWLPKPNATELMHLVLSDLNYRNAIQQVFAATFKKYKHLERLWTRQERAGEWTVLLRRELSRSALTLEPWRFYPYCNFRSLFKDLYDVDCWFDVAVLRKSNPADELRVVVGRLLERVLAENEQENQLGDLSGIVVASKDLVGDLGRLNAQLQELIALRP